jgi:hypothetical protein
MPVAAFSIRNVLWLKLSGRGALLAAKLLSMCGFKEGCPVLNLHFSFGLAAQTGQRTDSICVRGSAFTAHRNCRISAESEPASVKNALP